MTANPKIREKLAKANVLGCLRQPKLSNKAPPPLYHGMKYERCWYCSSYRILGCYVRVPAAYICCKEWETANPS